MCGIHLLKQGFHKCNSQKEDVGIQWKKGRRKIIVWLCEKCWGKIARGELEWGEQGKP